MNDQTLCLRLLILSGCSFYSSQGKVLAFAVILGKNHRYLETLLEVDITIDHISIPF